MAPAHQRTPAPADRPPRKEIFHEGSPDVSSPARTRRRRALRAAARCADCNSDVRVVVQQDGVNWFELFHANTCPWFGARGGQPFKQLRIVSLR
jgi:hypothetical protein